MKAGEYFPVRLALIPEPFSRRNRVQLGLPDRNITDDATRPARLGIVLAAEAPLKPNAIRKVVCRRLVIEPDPGNWTEYPNVWEEVKSLVQDRPWYRVFDIAEDLYRSIDESGRPPGVDEQMWNALRATRVASPGGDRATQFEVAVNEVLANEGIAWVMEGGLIVRYGFDEVRSAIHRASEGLSDAGLTDGADTFRGAIEALSARPRPNVRGAVTSALGALEGAMRAATGEPKLTLGELLKRYPHVFPPPMNEVFGQTWGYASDTARHFKEGGAPDPVEAEFIVGLAAVAATYLARKVASKR